jgi:polysaccharide export outer membrane protein
MFGKFSFLTFFLILTLFSTCVPFPDFCRAQPESSHYLIGANDVLSIYVWKEPDLTRDVTVMPDGRITFPLIGEIVAQGQTVNQVKETISQKLEKFVTAPEVTVIVSQSLSRTVYTIGKVTRPGPYSLAPNMTVLQALSAAGGFTEWADTKNIIIVRREGTKEVQLQFNYKEFTDGRNLRQNILLNPNDTIVVP